MPGVLEELYFFKKHCDVSYLFFSDIKLILLKFEGKSKSIKRKIKSFNLQDLKKNSIRHHYL